MSVLCADETRTERAEQAVEIHIRYAFVKRAELSGTALFPCDLHLLGQPAPCDLPRPQPSLLS